MARKFLYFIAAIIVLVFVGALVLAIWSKELTELAMVPGGEFVEQQPLEENAYQDPAMWFSRPGIGTSDPARWQPAMREERSLLPAPADPSQAAQDFAVFFVHPTSYLDRSNWNAPLDDAESQRIARIYVRGLASPFNQASEIWAPRYRQATFGAFLTDSEDSQNALNAAYDDVKQAYDFFLSSIDDNTPVVLAGHSQGSVHLLRLLKDHVNGSPVTDRLVAVYAIGWPISVAQDLPALGIPACATAKQSGCLISWSSFAEPADPSQVLEAYQTSIAFDGKPRGNSRILCTNPLTGGIGGAAEKALNRGTLVPEEGFTSGELVPNEVPARCDERGLLLIGDPPEMGSYVLPGNNYHVYDIPLFWKNLQNDVVTRVNSLSARP